ncbi:MAG TPA: diaminopimelate epimerase [Dehalococcoidia bacterium]|nr:diaminopimelate epimerase [Dehalococcoidia bacterium]
MNFTKLQGAGNDFILVDARNQERDWPKLAAAMCDRHYGIGGDGLLLLLPSAKADFCMRVYNADGSEAEACGNGLRCFVRYLLENGLTADGADHILIETRAGISEVRLQQTANQLPAIQVSLGLPVFKASEIPVTIDVAPNIVDIKPILDYPVVIDGDTLPMSFVSLGNPHAVYFVAHPVADFPLSQTGPKVERHRMFPNRVNFEVARVIDRQRIEARVWERGVGETLACGTGAAAIAVIARLHGLIDRSADIKLPGGTLNVEWDGAGEVLLSGPAETVFTGEWPTEV